MSEKAKDQNCRGLIVLENFNRYQQLHCMSVNDKNVHNDDDELCTE